MTMANRMAWAGRFGEPVPTIEDINRAVARVTLLATTSVDDACQAWLDAVTARADAERLMALIGRSPPRPRPNSSRASSRPAAWGAEGSPIELLMSWGVGVGRVPAAPTP